MIKFTRATSALGAAAAAVGLAACGSPSAPASPTATALQGPSLTPQELPTASASPSAAASAITLSVADLPSGGPTLTQISDGEMNSTPNTDQRGFANTGNTYRIEDDVLLDTSEQSAAADYAQLRDAAKSQFATLSSSSSPSGLGSVADEYVGKTSAGYSEVGITFQHGSVIAILLIVNSSGTITPAYAEAVAQAQDQKIASALD